MNRRPRLNDGVTMTEVRKRFVAPAGKDRRGGNTRLRLPRPSPSVAAIFRMRKFDDCV